jgi:hypothetical protein
MLILGAYFLCFDGFGLLVFGAFINWVFFGVSTSKLFLNHFSIFPFKVKKNTYNKFINLKW